MRDVQCTSYIVRRTSALGVYYKSHRKYTIYIFLKYILRISYVIFQHKIIMITYYVIFCKDE